MKLILLIILPLYHLCLCQHHHSPHVWRMVPYPPKAMFFGYPMMTSESSDLNDYSNLFDSSSSDEFADLIQSRTPAVGRYPLPQQRLFFGGFPTSLTTSPNPFSVFYRTVVTTTTSTTTVTTAAVTSCIPTGYFVAGSAGNTCARRRREAVIELLVPSDDDQEPISPSNIVQVVPTAAPTLIQQLKDSNDKELVLSSKSDAEIPEEQQRQRRSFFFNYAVTITSTSTTTVYNSTAIKKTLNLLTSVAASLICIPSGYVVC